MCHDVRVSLEASQRLVGWLNAVIAWIASIQLVTLDLSQSPIGF